MNLEEQLKMATMTTTTPVAPQEQSAPVAVNATPQTQVQAEAQVVQTTTPVAPPVQLASVQELQPQQGGIPTVQESSGVRTIKLGQTVNTNPVKIIKKLNVGDQLRITLLPADAQQYTYHYMEGMGGNRACFEGSCCKDFGKAKSKYLLPVMVYPTIANDPNTPIQGQPAYVAGLLLWEVDAYLTAATLSPDIVNNPTDLIVKCTDTYGRVSILPAPGPSQRNLFAEDFKKATDLWEIHKLTTVPSQICRPMDEQSYAEAKAKLAQAGPNNSVNYNNNYSNNNYQNLM